MEIFEKNEYTAHALNVLNNLPATVSRDVNVSRLRTYALIGFVFHGTVNTTMVETKIIKYFLRFVKPRPRVHHEEEHVHEHDCCAPRALDNCNLV